MSRRRRWWQRLWDLLRREQAGSAAASGCPLTDEILAYMATPIPEGPPPPCAFNVIPPPDISGLKRTVS